ALGAQVGVVTSAGPELDLGRALKDVLISRLPASKSTTFENVYTGRGRQQVIRSRAGQLGREAIPRDWVAGVVHIGPVAQECDPALVDGFKDAFVGVTPQGWMRAWDRTGRVRRIPWPEADHVLPRADAVVLSDEDVDGDETVIAEYAREARCLAVTRGGAGCTVYSDGSIRHIGAPQADEVDPTGAGDVFAASFFYALAQGHHAWIAARFANCIAARSVTRRGLLSTPSDREVAHCRRTTLGNERDDADRVRAG
ncbi:MAG: PfkB family carbohydrate kinase, partial [Chloroflexota bacterium]